MPNQKALSDVEFATVSNMSPRLGSIPVDSGGLLLIVVDS